MTAADHFSAILPRKRVAADCLIFDHHHRFLVVQPLYKNTWDLPGGVAEADESPWRAARREVAEEVGLEVNSGRLLAVDWIARVGPVTEVVAFLFDGGSTATPDSGLTLQRDEIRSARFVDLDEAGSLLDPEALARITHALDARRQGHTVYLENGIPPSD